MSGRPWSDEEIAILREAYRAGGAKAAMAALPGRSRCACYGAAFKHGIASDVPAIAPNIETWTQAEMDTLRRIYPQQGPKAAAAALPGRTWKACADKAANMGLPTFYKGWTTREIAILRQAYRLGGQAAAARALPGRSERACMAQAYRLGIRRGGDWQGERRKPPSTTPPEKRAAIVAAHVRGFRQMDIAQAVGVCVATVRKIVKSEVSHERR